MEIHAIYEPRMKLASYMWYAVSGTGESPLMRVGHTMSHHVVTRPTEADTDMGALYVVGGANPSGTFADVCTLDLNTLAWDKWDQEDGDNEEERKKQEEEGKESPSLDDGWKKGRYEHACIQTSSRPDSLFVFGGADEQQTYDDVLRFDLTHKTIEKVAAAVSANANRAHTPTARTFHTGVSYKGQLVVFGGGKVAKSDIDDQRVYIFNPVANKWIALDTSSQGLATPPSRHGHVMIRVEGADDDTQRIFMHGGMSGERMFDDVWMLDMKSIRWTRVVSSTTSGQSGPCARAAHGGVSVATRVFIFGGVSEAMGALDELWKFDTGKLIFINLINRYRSAWYRRPWSNMRKTYKTMVL